MRCFVSLDLSSGVVDEIVKIQDVLRKKNLFSGKFTEKENIHLTLKFLGEIGENKVEKVKRVLSRIEFGGFAVQLGGLGFFSRRIFWVEIVGDGVFGLQKKVDESLKGLFDEEVRFMSHVTIARIKRIGDFEKLKSFVEGIDYLRRDFGIESFSLKKSVLSKDEIAYEDLTRVGLNRKVL